MAEIRDEPYSKATHRRELLPKLDDRTEGSIEFKHQNISAVLLASGHACIPGYKPARNYQALLEDVVLENIASIREEIILAENTLIERLREPQEIQAISDIVVEPPELRSDGLVRERRSRRPVKPNYAERESRNRALGERGEEFVLAVERQRLTEIGRTDLVTDVEWTSKVKGDGAGYDIRSFTGESDKPLYIEVKTTNAGKYQPFLISANELAFSEEYNDSFRLCRVFEFSKNAKLFQLDGSISSNVNLNATVFKASF